ncbi:MAG: hypothetical protein U1E60_07060 [Reyranellaceae bacterium]
MDDVTVARAIHVLAVIHWMGGVAFVTAIVLPAIAAAPAGQRFALFEAIEGRFAQQVRVSVPLAGLSGLYMAERLGAWERFLEPQGWWLAAMAALWLVFMAILFVVEPFVARDWFHHRALVDPDSAFRLVRRLHGILLSAGAAVATAGVLGAHGVLG